MNLPPLPQALVSLCLQSSLVLAPLSVYACSTKTAGKTLSAYGLFFLCCVLDTVVLFTPHLPWFHDLKWNWQGKFLEVVVFLLLAKLLKLPQSVSALVLPKELRCLIVALVVGALFAVIDGLGHSVSIETKVYEWTMPGLSEEIVFRGVMLGVLDQRLGRPWKILGVRMGLGAVITSLIFCLAHVLVIDRDWTLYFDGNGSFELLC